MSLARKMKRVVPMRGVAIVVWTLVLAACSVRGSGPGDLVGDVASLNGEVDGGDGGVAFHPHIQIKCDKPPTVTESKRVTIPAGTFTMGCNAAVDGECRPDELPSHPVRLDAFDIDVTEVTEGQYYGCVAAGKCGSPSCDWDPCDDGKRKDHPVVCVDFRDVNTYCAWKGMRLPTEAEWERAARGDDRRKYPWGNDGLDCAHANLASCPGPNGAPPGTLPVGSLPEGVSPYGVLDMAGNAGEWTSDFYDANYYATSPFDNPKGPDKAARHVGRGGSWNSTGVWQRASQRDDYEPEYVKNTFGLRCVK
jgi:iron(II)-dependent oxidoreductase